MSRRGVAAANYQYERHQQRVPNENSAIHTSEGAMVARALHQRVQWKHYNTLGW